MCLLMFANLFCFRIKRYQVMSGQNPHIVIKRKKEWWRLTKTEIGAWLNCAFLYNFFAVSEILFFQCSGPSFIETGWVNGGWITFTSDSEPPLHVREAGHNTLTHNHLIVFPPRWFLQSTPIITYWDPTLMRPTHSLTELPWSSTS